MTATRAHLRSLPRWTTLQRFLGELPEGFAGGSASSGRQEQRPNQSPGALELHLAPAPRAFCEEDAFVFKERGDARDLLGCVLARIQSPLLKQHKVSHYEIFNADRACGLSPCAPAGSRSSGRVSTCRVAAG